MPLSRPHLVWFTTGMIRFASIRPRFGALLRLALVLAVAGLVAPGHQADAASAASSPHFVDGHGLHIVKVTRFDARDYDVRVLSPDLGRPIDIRLLLPVDYRRHPTTRYPVLYLFHGTGGIASDWVLGGHAEQATAPYRLITVMPEVGFDGDGGFWFTNWVDRTTSHGPSQFEDYLIDALIPWIDENLRTIPSRDGRAVAGLSQGGYGSTEMAARHPALFCSMASFSGAPEIERDPEVFAGAVGVIEAIEVGEDKVAPFSELGNPELDNINWQGHDPATLIENLRGMSIDMWTGMGVDGPYDATPDPAASGIEALVYESTQHFYQHLVDAGIPAYYDNYVYGTHSFPYWARDLRAYLPKMMADFARPKTPRVVSYTSIDKQWSQWGYTVTMKRDVAQQFTTLSNGTSRGFTLTGGGIASITTPADYQPGSTLRLNVTVGSSTTQRLVPVDSSRRITLSVDLGQAGQATVSIRAGGA
jgi:S-formylglutathione hydrolase FrmB